MLAGRQAASDGWEFEVSGEVEDCVSEDVGAVCGSAVVEVGVEPYLDGRMACVAGSGEEGVSGCDGDRVGQRGTSRFRPLLRCEAASRSGEALGGGDWCPEVEGCEEGLGAAADVVDAELEVQVRST